MATRTWRGGAPNVAEVQSFTVAGTWANNDSAAFTINGKTLTVTISSLSGNTLNSVVNQLYAGWNASAITEFAEITAARASNTRITLTHDTAGVPFTVTATNTTAGDGTLTGPATNTAASGWYTFNTAANWSGATVPVNTDDVVFEHSDTDCKYQLDQSSKRFASLSVRQSFTGEIGLSRTRGSGSSAYVEYRDTHLKAAVNTVTIGEGDGTGSGRINLDLDSTPSGVVHVYDSGQRAETGIESIQIKGTVANSTLNVYKGTVGLARFAGETAAFHTIRAGYTESVLGDVTLYSGSGTTINTLTQSGGVVETNAGLTTINQTGGTLTVRDGSITTLSVDGGTTYYHGDDTITTLNVGSGGTVDFSRDLRGRTVSACDMYSGGKLSDPYKTVTWTAGIDLNRCGLSDVKLDLGDNLTINTFAI